MNTSDGVTSSPTTRSCTPPAASATRAPTACGATRCGARSRPRPTATERAVRNPEHRFHCVGREWGTSLCRRGDVFRTLERRAFDRVDPTRRCHYCAARLGGVVRVTTVAAHWY